MSLWLFAIKTLLADRGKLITALVGVGFCVILVNIQGGLFLGLIHKSTMLVDHGEADIWVGHKEMHCVDLSMEIPRDWAHRLLAVPGVRTADPYQAGYAGMSLPNGSFEGVAVIGVDRQKLIGGNWRFAAGGPDDLRTLDGVIVDEYEDSKLQAPQIGEVREIGGHRTRIVAKSRGVTNFLIAPYVFTTFDRAGRILGRSSSMCSYLLVTVEPGADPDAVCRLIHARAPQLDAFTREEFSRRTAAFWLTRTGMGISFGLATLLGLGVGLVTVAQTLHALALDRLDEYTTLRALGADDSQLAGLLVAQSSAIGVAGCALGLGLVTIVALVCSTPIAPIEVPVWMSLLSVALLLAVCTGISILPYVRLRELDARRALQVG
jgi:putative ABC transport system permease protein